MRRLIVGFGVVAVLGGGAVSNGVQAESTCVTPLEGTHLRVCAETTNDYEDDGREGGHRAVVSAYLPSPVGMGTYVDVACFDNGDGTADVRVSVLPGQTVPGSCAELP